MDDIIVFGTGYYWEKRKNYVLNKNNILCFLDNDSSKEKKELCGKSIFTPKECKRFEYNYILIISDKYEEEMQRQLLDIGVDSYKILNWEKYVEFYFKEEYIEYIVNRIDDLDTLIISNYLDYTGAPMTAIYAAYALQNNGKKVILCAENADERLIMELRGKIDIVLIPSLQYCINRKFADLISKSNNIIINTFVLFPIVYRLSEKKNILWWIHETKNYFDEKNNWQIRIKESIFNGVNVRAVSNMVKRNFNSFFMNIIEDVMPYGIPDKRESCFQKQSDKITFALIGTVTPRKGQDIYIESIKNLEPDIKRKAEFYIIGECVENNYTKRIMEETKQIDDVYLIGTMTRSDLYSFLPKIDVVVCPSREEPMSIALTEAMMFGKPCIGSDNTGMSDYINDGINGFVCKTENIYDLRDKMEYFICNPQKINEMGNEARKVYDEYFSMTAFYDRLDEALN